MREGRTKMVAQKKIPPMRGDKKGPVMTPSLMATLLNCMKTRGKEKVW